MWIEVGSSFGGSIHHQFNVNRQEKTKTFTKDIDNTFTQALDNEEQSNSFKVDFTRPKSAQYSPDGVPDLLSEF